MRPDAKILDDIARVAGGAVNILSGVQQQIRDEIHARMDDAASRMDLVPREDLDRAMAMIAKLRARSDELEARLDALEGKKTKAAKEKPKAKKATNRKKK